MQDALVATSPKGERGVELRLHKGTIDQRIDIVEAGATRLIGQQSLIGVAGIAPDILLSFGLEPLQQSQQGRRIVKGVSPREGDAVEQGVALYLGHHAVEQSSGERLTRRRIPAAGIVTPRAAVRTPGQIDGITNPETIGDGLWIYLDKM